MMKVFIFGWIAASCALASTPCHRALTQGHSLEPGEAVCSPNGNFRTVLQTDGNLVTYLVRPLRGEPVRAVFATMTSTGARLELSENCNLALVDRAGGKLLETHTADKEKFCELVLFNDGHLQLESAVDPAVSNPVWDDGFLRHVLWTEPESGKFHYRGVFQGVADDGSACELDINHKRFSIGGYHYIVESSYLDGWYGPNTLSISGWAPYAGHHTYHWPGSRWYSDLLWPTLNVEGRITLDDKGAAQSYQLSYFRLNDRNYRTTTLGCRELRFQ